MLDSHGVSIRAATAIAISEQTEMSMEHHREWLYQ